MNEVSIAERRAWTSHGEKLLASDPGFGAFYAHTLAATDEHDLKHLNPQSFEAILRQSYVKLGARRTGGHTVDFREPQVELPRKVLIIDILVDDMPFVVDSILAAIRAHGGIIRLMSHPVLPIDTSTSPWTVLPKHRPDAHHESFLQVHIDPISDEERRNALEREINEVLIEVRRVVRGWRPMLERLRQVVQDYRQHPPKVPAAALAETLHFLAWLADHNFTFLGMREYRFRPERNELNQIEDSGLGVLEDPEYRFLRQGDDYVEMTEQHVAFLKKSEPLMVTKANVRSRVHRRAHMEYIGVKLYHDDGTCSGELRILGLFTSMSLATPHAEVPLIRRKISEVMRRSQHDPRSHAGKALMSALDSYPREELFQMDEETLYEYASMIARLAERPRLRVLPRIDPFDNFVSILLYMPRDRYNSDVREKIGDYLASAYDGRVSNYSPSFPEGDMVRVHFLIGRNSGKTPHPDREKVERDVTELTRTFGDRLRENAEDPGAISDYFDAFSPGYQSHNNAERAIADIGVFKTLSKSDEIAVRFELSDERKGAYALKIYHYGTPIPLSDRVPMLEHFGFNVIDERTHTLRPLDGEPRYLHDMILRLSGDSEIEMDEVRPLFEQALSKLWTGDIENDGFNQLVIKAKLPWDDVALLRALGRYLKQIGVAYSQHYLWNALAAHPSVPKALVALFHVRLDPRYTADRDTAQARIQKEMDAALERVSSIDEDRIIRHFRNLVEAATRTNFYQRDTGGARRPALAIKYECAEIEGLPAPRPFREIHVYAPRVEGVHLRGGSIARGGLRWSDRPEDFRTEVLGLMKAQMVKNAVIVPVGAKGGFVPKHMPPNPSREQMFEEGTACYKIFIGALLDVTDNLEADRLLPPPQTVRTDGDDPYLVVAADKGTASFSDTANAIAVERNFWLGDAFASGGSAGYDHKKMGITARGGWEAVKRHFRELNHDIQTEHFTAVGVGDMSGDVFGNGMLLSRQTRLIAAFDHRDIFIDPAPDTETSFMERKRLFEMPRSSWQDYDTSLISTGGGVYSRSLKTVTLSHEARDALGIGEATLTPAALISHILQADVDLLWFGGIGTYVRAKGESESEVGDRANDAIRVYGSQVNAKVIGEGANLGVTQRGRIEYALKGGRINTDAIDNSAGVNSSDLEVNIKIALGGMVRAGRLSMQDRNAFLVDMTDEVAALCLKNNYLQTLALSLAERRGLADMPDQMSFMQELEIEGGLNRAVEFLPDDHALHERANTGHPLTRPELAVMLAYAKNTLYQQLLTSEVPDDPYLSKELFNYFPDRLRQRYPDTIEKHRLRREVISTVLSNALINRGGPTFVHQMTQSTSATAPQVAFAYAAARDSFGLQEINAAIDRLDAQMDGQMQLELYAEVQTLQVNQTLWFLRNIPFDEGLSNIISRFYRGIASVQHRLSMLMPKVISQSVSAQTERFVAGGAPHDIARRVAELSALTLASDIVLVAEQAESEVTDAALAYFAVLEAFNLGRITEHSHTISLADRYDRMALDRALANLLRAQREITADVLASGHGAVNERFKAWHGARAAEIDRIIGMVRDLTEGDLTVSRLSVAAGLLADLVRART